MAYSRTPPPSGHHSTPSNAGQSIEVSHLPTGNPPPYAFVAKVYQRSLRPVVLLTCFAAWLWSLLWGIGNFQDISGDNSHNLHKFVVFDIVLGTLHLTTAAIEMIGFASAVLQSLPISRIYALLSLVAALVTATAEMMNVVLHFVFKNDLINECVATATGQTVNFNFGFFGGHSSETLSPEDAQNFCKNAWDHDTFSDIAWFIVTTILGLLFSSIAWGYYRQLSDPTSVVSRLPRSEAVRMDDFNAPYSHTDYQPRTTYAPPPGPPPTNSDAFVPPYDPAKLPTYGYGEPSKVSDNKEDLDETHA